MRNRTNLLQDRNVFHERCLWESRSQCCQNFRVQQPLTLLIKQRNQKSIALTLRKKLRIQSYSGPYFPAFGLNRSLRISPYSVRMWENTDQNNSEYGHFTRIVVCTAWFGKTVLNQLNVVIIWFQIFKAATVTHKIFETNSGFHRK